MGGLVGERFAAFRKHDIAPAEYDYLENLVYVTWLGGIAAEGDDPAARERAAHEIDQAAARESAGAVRTRLQQVAAADKIITEHVDDFQRRFVSCGDIASSVHDKATVSDGALRASEL